MVHGLSKASLPVLRNSTRDPAAFNLLTVVLNLDPHMAAIFMTESRVVRMATDFLVSIEELRNIPLASTSLRPGQLFRPMSGLISESRDLRMTILHLILQY